MPLSDLYCSNAKMASLFDDWDEPNDSRKLGPNEPNEVVDEEFCLVDRFGPNYWLYQRCDARAPARSPTGVTAREEAPR